MLQFEVKKTDSALNMTINDAVVVRGADGITSEQIDKIVVLDREEYESLTERPSTTLYVIRG